MAYESVASGSSAPSADSPAAELTDLYRSWGVLDLLDESIEELPREWLRILDIARNLLDGNPIPGVTIPTAITTLLSRADDATYERKVVKRKAAPRASERIEEPSVRPIESFSEFPKIIAGQRMWQFIDPELFVYRIYAHDMLVREMEERPAAAGEEDEVEEEIVIITKLQRKPRQRVLVLRDTSSSMRDNNKGIFAKAVALAYLIKAQEEGAEVGDRSFANTVHERMRATSPAEFAGIARRILREGYYGTTNLAAAFETTMSEIRREELGLNPFARAKTEILLISDCENPEQLPPLPPGVAVNTLHLAGGREGLMVRNYEERLREIEAISTAFVRIDTSALEIPDKTRESWLLLEESKSLAAEMGVASSNVLSGTGELRERLERIDRLTKVHERMTRGTRQHKNWKMQMGRGHRGERAGLLAMLLAWLARLREIAGMGAAHVPAIGAAGTGPHHAAHPEVVFRPKVR